MYALIVSSSTAPTVAQKYPGAHRCWPNSVSASSGTLPAAGVTTALDANGNGWNGLAGATRRDRTGDLLITNQPLYQLS